MHIEDEGHEKQSFLSAIIVFISGIFILRNVSQTIRSLHSQDQPLQVELRAFKYTDFETSHENLSSGCYTLH